MLKPPDRNFGIACVRRGTFPMPKAPSVCCRPLTRLKAPLHAHLQDYDPSRDAFGLGNADFGQHA
jgi:hypothetical protein